MSSATLDDVLEEPAPPPDAPVTDRPTTEPFGSRARWAAPWLAMLVVAAALAPLRDRWLVQALLLTWLLLAPGRLLLTALRVRPLQVRRFPVYIPAMSLLLIMITGLAVDGIGIAAGADAPLRTAPLWLGTAIVYVVLVAAACVAPATVRPSLTRPPAVAAYWVLALPLLAAAGAARLNAGNGSTVAVVAMVALVAVWLVRPFLPGFTWRVASITVYAVSLAGTWSFSLRGDSVYGYDIITEYFIARGTVAEGVWHLHHPDDAYGGLLSVTILPASLHSVAGVALLAVFKLVFPALFAFVPVAVLRIAGRLLSVRWAYAAVGVVIGQSFFFDSMPAVARQEIAFVFFVVVVAALLESRGRAAVTLLVLGAVGMVLSHYSSTYMAAALTGAAFVFAVVGRVLRRRPPILRSGIAFVVLLGGALLWYRGLTDSASNVTNVADSFKSNGFDLLPNRGSNIISTIVNGNVAKALTPQQYADAIAQRYAQQFPYVHPSPDAAQYPLQPPPALAGGGAVAGLSGAVVSVIGQLVNVLAVIGTLVLTFGRRRGATARAVGLLSLGVLGFLAAVRLSGTLAVSYNQERAQIQAFVLLAPVALWTVTWVIGALGVRYRGPVVRHRIYHSRWALSLSVLLSSVLMANAAGILQRHPEAGVLANMSAGPQAEARFVLNDSDLSSSRWLAGQAKPADLRYADSYGALRIVATSGTLSNVLMDVTPKTLAKRAWIYVSSANERTSAAIASFGGRSVRYAFPFVFIRKDFDRVYDNGSSEVYQ